MSNRFFDAENPVWVPFGKLVDLVCLSVLWVVCSLPLVTLGPATAALYDVTARCVRRGDSGPYARFFRTLRANLKTGAVTGLLVLLMAVYLFLAHRQFYLRATAGERGVWYALYFTFWVVALAVIGTLGYLLPTLSRFTFDLGGLWVNSLRLAVVHLPSTLLLGVILAGTFVAAYAFPLALFFLPCLSALLCSLPLERIFRPYMDPEP